MAEKIQKKKDNIQNMTEGNPMRLIVTFAFPLMIGNIFQQLYTMVDTMVVGRGLGVGALAALGAADIPNWMVLAIMMGFTQGFSIKMAQDFGAGQNRVLCRTIGNSVVLSVWLTVILAVGSQLICRPAMEWMQTPDAIMKDALIYLRVVFLGIPAIMAYNFLSSVLRALGDGKTPLNAMIVSSVINIVLDLVFVLVFHWGIAGAAIATVIAQLCSAWICYRAMRRIEILQFRKEDFHLNRELCMFLMKLGTPMAFQNAVISVGSLVVQYVVNGFGVLFVAGMAATNKLYGVLEVAATSYGYAMVTYVGQNLGAGKTDRISKGMRSALVSGILIAFGIAACMLIWGRNVVGLFLSGTAEEVATTMEIAYSYLRIMSIGLWILYVLHIVRSALQGMGDTVLPMVSGIAELIMRIGAVLILPLFLGSRGVYYAEALAWFGADLILVPTYLYRMHRIKAGLPPMKGTENA